MESFARRYFFKTFNGWYCAEVAYLRNITFLSFFLKYKLIHYSRFPDKTILKNDEFVKNWLCAVDVLLSKLKNGGVFGSSEPS